MSPLPPWTIEARSLWDLWETVQNMLGYLSPNSHHQWLGAAPRDISPRVLPPCPACRLREALSREPRVSAAGCPRQLVQCGCQGDVSEAPKASAPLRSIFLRSAGEGREAGRERHTGD